MAVERAELVPGVVWTHDGFRPVESSGITIDELKRGPPIANAA